MLQEQRRITSYSNEPEALLCVAILRHLQARYGVDIAKRAAIITFYAGQVEVCTDRFFDLLYIYTFLVV